MIVSNHNVRIILGGVNIKVGTNTEGKESYIRVA